jgi:hypothetical protein
VQFGAAAPDALAKAHDGIAVNACQTLRGANALAFSEAGDDLDLLVSGKNFHDGPNPSCKGTGTAGDATAKGLYFARSIALGPNPEVKDQGSALLAQRRAH